jgi:formate hydrogenlyase subunit 3/multisubunit Na+/H+ antiporter MnhD subunit
MPGLAGVQMLGVLSLAAGAVLAWRSRETEKQLSYVFLSQVGGLVMVLTMGTAEAITATLVGLVSLILAASALFVQAVSCRHALSWPDRVLLLVSLASLAGVPPLLGFWGRWMGYNVLLEGNQPGMFLLALGCHISVLIALLRGLGQYMQWDTTTAPAFSLSAKEIKGEGVRWVAVGLLSLPLVLLGLWPPATLAAWRPTVALMAGIPAPALSPTALSPTADALTPWLTLGGLLLSLGAILGLSGWLRLPRIGRMPSSTEEQPRMMHRLYEMLDLAWAYRLGWGAFVRLNELLAGLASMLDGDYALAWVVLLAFVVALFLLGGGALP